MSKLNKKTILQAEKNWNFVFTVQKWDELLPKEGISSIEGLPVPKMSRPKSLTDKRSGSIQEPLKIRVGTSDNPEEGKVHSQVEFLYSIWEKAPKSKKIILKPVRPKHQSVQPTAAHNTPGLKIESGPETGSQTSTFYKINHSRNKVTNSYNYVVRKSNLQFVCKEKELEEIKFELNRDPFYQASIEDDFMAKNLSTPAPMAVARVTLRIDDGLPAKPKDENKFRKSMKNIRLAKIRRQSKDKVEK